MKHVVDKYHATRDGKIFNRRTNKVLAPQDNGNGYKKVTLTVEGKPIQKYIHRVIAHLFIPNPDNLPQVNHKNGNKSDNRAENLEWCTNQQNQIHAHTTGLKQNGVECWNGKLTDEQVAEIKILHAKGNLQYKIARQFNVSKSTICEIIKGNRYKYALTGTELTIKDDGKKEGKEQQESGRAESPATDSLE